MTERHVELTREWEPASAGELARALADNAAAAEPEAVFPIGGRTAMDYGLPAARPGMGVKLTPLCEVIDYPARDMTITVEAGIRVGELQKLLAEQQQQLPIDVPLASRATLGGALVTNASGSRRFGYGTFRDYVIGMSAVDAEGREFHAGGRVVKNVAGYDLCKLMVGSQGTLALVTQVTLKLKPLPQAVRLQWSTWSDWDDLDLVLERLLTTDTRPVAFDVFNPAGARHIAGEIGGELPVDEPVLCIRLEGLTGDVEWQARKLDEELGQFAPSAVEWLQQSSAEAVCAAVTEYASLADAPLTFRAVLRPSRLMELVEFAGEHGISVTAQAANGIVVGHFPEESGTLEQVAPVLAELRERANAADGNLVIMQCPLEWKRSLPVWGTPRGDWRHMVALKSRLDPAGLLNPGRFIDGCLP